jgi:ABC-type nickel/cobalt efflux system permease component RcnA
MAIPSIYFAFTSLFRSHHRKQAILERRRLRQLHTQYDRHHQHPYQRPHQHQHLFGGEGGFSQSLLYASGLGGAMHRMRRAAYR